MLFDLREVALERRGGRRGEHDEERALDERQCEQEALERRPRLGPVPRLGVEQRVVGEVRPRAGRPLAVDARADALAAVKRRAQRGDGRRRGGLTGGFDAAAERAGERAKRGEQRRGEERAERRVRRRGDVPVQPGRRRAQVRRQRRKQVPVRERRRERVREEREKALCVLAQLLSSDKGRVAYGQRSRLEAADVKHGQRLGRQPRGEHLLSICNSH